MHRSVAIRHASEVVCQTESAYREGGRGTVQVSGSGSEWHLYAATLLEWLTGKAAARCEPFER